MSRFSPQVAREYAGPNGTELERIFAQDAQRTRQREQDAIALDQAGYRRGTAPASPAPRAEIEAPKATLADAFSSDALNAGAHQSGPSASASEPIMSSLQDAFRTTPTAAAPSPAPAAPPGKAPMPGAFDPAMGGFRPARVAAMAPAPQPYHQVTDDLYRDETATPEARRQRFEMEQKESERRLATEFAGSERDRKAAALRAAGVPENKIAIALEFPSAADQVFRDNTPSRPEVKETSTGLVVVNPDGSTRPLLGSNGKALMPTPRAEAQEHWTSAGVDKDGNPLLLNTTTGETKIGGGVKGQQDVAKPSEFSNKAALVYPRAAEAAQALAPFFSSGMPAKSMLGRMTFGQYGLDERTQRAVQAAETISSAILRLESGAAISEHEVKEYARQFLPQPGDSKEVLLQKQQTLATQLERMRMAAFPTMHREPASTPSNPWRH
jgi:hypothetical protein